MHHSRQYMTVALGTAAVATHDEISARVSNRASRAKSPRFASDAASEEDFSALLLASGEPRAIVVGGDSPPRLPAQAPPDLSTPSWSGTVATIHKDSGSPPSANAAPNLQLSTAKSWAPRHRHSQLALPQAETLNSGVYSSGLDLPRAFRDAFEDKLRFFLEGCDIVGGFHVLCDIDNGYGGMCEALCEMLKDDVSHASVLWGAFQDPESQTLSAALSIARIAPQSLVTCPMSALAGVETRAGALDLITLPYRVKTQKADMRLAYASVLAGPGMNLAALQWDETACSPHLLASPPATLVRGRVLVGAVRLRADDTLAELFARADRAPRPARDSYVMCAESPAFPPELSLACMQSDSNIPAYLQHASAVLAKRTSVDASRFERSNLFERDDWSEAIEAVQNAAGKWG
jgi:hypothetical protein